jgi:hypothetical protein
MKNVFPAIGMITLLTAVAITATQKSLVLDTSNHEGYGIVAQFGANTGTAFAAGTQQYALKLQESATTNDVDFTDVAATDYATGYGPLVVASNAFVGAPLRFEYIGRKRYIRLVATVTGTPANILSVIGCLGTGRRLPEPVIGTIGITAT